MFILKKGHQPGVYVPLRALFLVNYVTVQLICGFVLACAKSRFSHDAIHIETYLHVYILSMT